MKTMIHRYSSIIVLGLALATAPVAFAQTASETTTTTTTSAGTVSEFTPDAFTIQTDTSAAPVRYTYSKTTTYVDENGNPVSMETVKSGLPVTVYYTQVNGQMVASKVIVRKSVTTNADGSVIEHKKTTTTTTTPNP